MRATPRIKPLLRRNRQPENGAPRASFSLRKFLLFGVGMSVLFGLRCFVPALCLFVYAVIFYGCLGLGASLTRQDPQAAQLSSIDIRNRFTLPALGTVIICTVASHFLWTLFILFLPLDADMKHAFLEVPVVGGFALFQVQQWLYALLHTALLFSFFANCWNATRVDGCECRTTAAFSTLLTFSHFAQPYFAKYWFEFVCGTLSR
ncbi:hypothetical protein [Anatilimnocola floriformis]|uniref:hypothetical protein n=1 Tax=Anatilimnocola floriformis TaxID=2948575 RepID=UPI0020C2A872|nr:hypothetical protein [Anatilimnocola floriformis]